MVKGQFSQLMLNIIKADATIKIFIFILNYLIQALFQRIILFLHF